MAHLRVNSAGSQNYYQGDAINGEWYTPDIGITATTRWVTANQGPCQTGYHIPSAGTSDTTTEWGKAFTLLGSAYDPLRNALRLPLAGYRLWNTAQYYRQGSYGFYSSSTPNGAGVYHPTFTVGGYLIADTDPRGHAFPVRCIRN